MSEDKVVHVTIGGGFLEDEFGYPQRDADGNLLMFIEVKGEDGELRECSVLPVSDE